MPLSKSITLVAATLQHFRYKTILEINPARNSCTKISFLDNYNVTQIGYLAAEMFRHTWRGVEIHPGLLPNVIRISTSLKYVHTRYFREFMFWLLLTWNVDRDGEQKRNTL